MLARALFVPSAAGTKTGTVDIDVTLEGAPNNPSIAPCRGGTWTLDASGSLVVDLAGTTCNDVVHHQTASSLSLVFHADKDAIEVRATLRGNDVHFLMLSTSGTADCATAEHAVTGMCCAHDAAAPPATSGPIECSSCPGGKSWGGTDALHVGGTCASGAECGEEAYVQAALGRAASAAGSAATDAGAMGMLASVFPFL